MTPVISNPTPDPDPAMNASKASRAISPALVIGIAVICFGAALLLDELGFGYLHYIFRLWPLVLVGIGLVKLWNCAWRCTSGYLLVALGGLLLLKTLGGGSMDDLFLPAIFITVGIFIVLHGLKRHRKVPPELQQAEGFLRGHAILSSFDQRSRIQAFKGGELTAIFGGFDIDLRQAEMEGPSARLDSFVMFGGGDLRVPEGWDVLIQATAIFGGVSDKRIPVPSSPEARPRLVVTGLILLGGIELKN